jgi:hypothetical protein
VVKPLPVAPLTKEDGDIWVRVINRSRRCFSAHDAGLYHRVTLGADRRDADLMLQAQEIASFGPTGIQLYGIDFRGWDCGWSLLPGRRVL